MLRDWSNMMNALHETGSITDAGPGHGACRRDRTCTTRPFLELCHMVHLGCICTFA